MPLQLMTRRNSLTSDFHSYPLRYAPFRAKLMAIPKETMHIPQRTPVFFQLREQLGRITNLQYRKSASYYAATTALLTTGRTL